MWCATSTVFHQSSTSLRLAASCLVIFALLTSAISGVETRAARTKEPAINLSRVMYFVNLLEMFRRQQTNMASGLFARRRQELLQGQGLDAVAECLQQRLHTYGLGDVVVHAGFQTPLTGARYAVSYTHLTLPTI